MVATFHLHYLGHRIKYGNLEVGNTTQKLLPNYCQHDHAAVSSSLNHFYFDSFLLSPTVRFLHCMLNLLRQEKIVCETDESITS